MSERAIVMLGLLSFVAVSMICGVIFEGVRTNHEQAMACIQSGGSSTQWGCFAKGLEVSVERRPLFGSAK